MKMQIKATMRYRLTPVRMAMIKTTTKTNASKYVGKKRTFIYTIGRNVNQHNPYREQYGGS